MNCELSAYLTPHTSKVYRTLKVSYEHASVVATTVNGDVTVVLISTPIESAQPFAGVDVSHMVVMSLFVSVTVHAITVSFPTTSVYTSVSISDE